MCYNSLQDEVTIQCDASQTGLEAALLQNGQPEAYASRALTPTESRYAQTEKELLAIVFACSRFNACVYDRMQVNIQTDHKPLEPIFEKPLASAPKRLQRMLLRLQNYSLRVNYKEGNEMILAESRLPARGTCTREPGEVDHQVWLPLTKAAWQQMRNAAVDDTVQQPLHKVIRSGWLGNRSEVPEYVCPYFDVSNERNIQGEFIFKGQKKKKRAS